MWTAPSALILAALPAALAQVQCRRGTSGTQTEFGNLCHQTINGGVLSRGSDNFNSITQSHCEFYQASDYLARCLCDFDECNTVAFPQLLSSTDQPLPNYAESLIGPLQTWVGANTLMTNYLWEESGAVYLAAMPRGNSADQVLLEAFFDVVKNALGITVTNGELKTLPWDIISNSQLDGLFDPTDLAAVFTVSTDPGAVPWSPGQPSLNNVRFNGAILPDSSSVDDALECEATCHYNEMCFGWTFWPASQWCNYYAYGATLSPVSQSTMSGYSLASFNQCHVQLNKRFDLADPSNQILLKSTTPNAEECCTHCLVDPACEAFYYKPRKQKCILLTAATGAEMATNSLAYMGRMERTSPGGGVQ